MQHDSNFTDKLAVMYSILTSANLFLVENENIEKTI